MESDRTAKRVYVGECAGIRSVGRPRKRWNDTGKDYLINRGLAVMKARRVVRGRGEWWWIVRGNAWGVAQGMNP